jgi:hypothetical protein
MGLFSKRQRTVVSPDVLSLLSTYGAAVLEARRAGRPLADSRFDWSNFVGPVHMELMSGDRESVIQELYDASIAAPDRDLATVGAYRLLAEFNESLDDFRFLRLYDASLEYMRKLGFSSGHLTGHEARRWVDVHGELRASFDGIFEVPVPSPAEAPDVGELEAGEVKKLVLTGPLPDGNEFLVERGTDGNYLVFSIRQRSDLDLTRERYDETQLGTFQTYPEVLRALGDMFGTPPYWADDDLEPYFPRRRA